jgi:hypothetical protein
VISVDLIASSATCAYVIACDENLFGHVPMRVPVERSERFQQLDLATNITALEMPQARAASHTEQHSTRRWYS